MPAAITEDQPLPVWFNTLTGITVDTGGATDVALVNETLARTYFADQEPIGRRLWWPTGDARSDREFEIVEVVRDTKTRDFFAEPEPTVYFSYPQHDTRPGVPWWLQSTVGPPRQYRDCTGGCGTSNRISRSSM